MISGFRCKFDIDNNCEADKCDKCKNHPMYRQGREDAIYEYMNKLCDKCIQEKNECWNLECPFADDECQIIKIAEQLMEKQ